jgi:hypothetical protein
LWRRKLDVNLSLEREDEPVPLVAFISFKDVSMED